MNKWMMAVVTAVTLSGCAQLPNYEAAVKTAPPGGAVGDRPTAGSTRETAYLWICQSE